ncbi:hypothetical protein [Streptomyces sp. VB1]|uniref:hypothetical protein n=1 Tax=Streptomyces sp. VB1 TaxID=2986803 RepID=UPI002242709B|nr:hypothetical protein [Streptomyces sp. VB1]UZI27179.1 hypothetical protein OH133_03090 [Streptomyces sp. VB1]
MPQDAAGVAGRGGDRRQGVAGDGFETVKQKTESPPPSVRRPMEGSGRITVRPLLEEPGRSEAT